MHTVGLERRWPKRLLLVGALCALLLSLGCAAWGASGAGAATAPAYAPVDTPGPPLSVPTSELSAALSCSGTLAGSAKTPVLLVPGTTINPTEFAWNWEPALSAQGIPWCTIDLPGNGMADIQTAGEYVVYAIRTMYAEAGEKIDIVGHSQGGMVPRWALRFWPDTRSMVDDMIGLSPSNHGTVDADALCLATCAPSIWQQQDDSNFTAALNSFQETFPGISYTDVYTDTDEVVVPNVGPYASSALHGGGGDITNVAIQQVCPLDPTEHIGIGTYDNTAYAIAMEAMTHSGPADPSLVPSSTCSDLLMPGVNPATFLSNFASTLGVVATTLASYPHTSSEPALACYVTASCTGSSAPSLTVKTAPAAKGDQAVSATVSTVEGGVVVPVQGATVTVNGTSATTDASGVASVPMAVTSNTAYRVVASMRGTNGATEQFTTPLRTAAKSTKTQRTSDRSKTKR